MAYLRPLNSSEANLFIIRLTTPNITPSTDLIQNGDYYKLNPIKFDNPSIDLLPQNFSYNIGNDTTSDYMINFGTMMNPFTEPPTVTITLMNSIDQLDINQYVVVIDNITTTSINFSLRLTTDQSGEKLVPYDGTYLTTPRFNIIILGSVISGATFAISNRGWNVPESNVSKLYTYQNVGIGTGKVDGTLNVLGTIVTPANLFIYNNTTTQAQLTAMIDNITTSNMTIITIKNHLSNPIDINLPNGFNGQVIKIYVTNKDVSSINNKIRLIGNNILENFTIVSDEISNTYIREYTKLYYDGTQNKWIVLSFTNV